MLGTCGTNHAPRQRRGLLFANFYDGRLIEGCAVFNEGVADGGAAHHVTAARTEAGEVHRCHVIRVEMHCVNACESSPPDFTDSCEHGLEHGHTGRRWAVEIGTR